MVSLLGSKRWPIRAHPLLSAFRRWGGRQRTALVREEESFLMLLHNMMAISVKCSYDICTNNNVEAGYCIVHLHQGLLYS